MRDREWANKSGYLDPLLLWHLNKYESHVGDFLGSSSPQNAELRWEEFLPAISNNALWSPKKLPPKFGEKLVNRFKNCEPKSARYRSLGQTQFPI